MSEIKRAIALGFFDGVHIGHGALLERTKQRAAQIGAMPSVLSFDVHPDNLVFGRETPLINSTIAREDIIRRIYGIDNVVFLHFNQHLMRMPWQDFADSIIQEYANPESPAACLHAAVQFMTENRRAVMHMYRSISHDTVAFYLMQICRHTVEAYAAAAYGDLPISKEDQDILILFWQCECYGQIVEWLSNDMRYDIQAQFDRLCTLYRGGFDAMVTQSLGVASH